MEARAGLRRWRLPLGVAALLALLQALGLRDALEYRRAAILRGQLWRLLTGSLVHLGWAHLVRNVVGLLLLRALFASRLDERAWLGAMAAGALAVGAGLLAFSPQIAWYVGISGALFAVFCAGALCEWRDHPLYAGALLSAMGAVIAWTLYAGALPGETAGLGGQVVPQAHLYGALGGAAFIAARHVRGRSGAAGAV